MGLIGVYIMVDENTLDDMMNLDGDALFDKVNKLEETNEKYTIDKLWDGLHFLLTDVSASEPIEGNKLSEAIVGVHVFDTNEDDFIACIENDELPEIVNALDGVDLKELEQKFAPKRFKEKRIYPNIWENNKKEELFAELTREYKRLLNFYKKALEKKAHIIYSVF